MCKTRIIVVKNLSSITMAKKNLIHYFFKLLSPWPSSNIRWFDPWFDPHHELKDVTSHS